jgi:hypothetical protein
MKKVLITESQLRAMVRKMLMEQTPMTGMGVGSTGFAPVNQQPKISPAAQSVINIINGPSGITNPNDLTTIINFITSKTSLKGSNTATVGRNIASSVKNVQTQAKV